MNQISKNKYDLEERTAKFGENIIDLCNKTPKNPIVTPTATQLVRSGTSIGANYCEANGASSSKDFRNKIHICKKEAQETKYWLRMLAHSVVELKETCRILWQEADGLARIFGKIAVNSLRKSQT
jgi:four helix bundle protein